MTAITQTSGWQTHLSMYFETFHARFYQKSMFYVPETFDKILFWTPGMQGPVARFQGLNKVRNKHLLAFPPPELLNPP